MISVLQSLRLGHSFACRFDLELGNRNIEYGAKRTSARLNPPEIWQARNGEFAAWRRRRVASGANDDQLKARHLTRDAGFAEEFTPGIVRGFSISDNLGCWGNELQSFCRE